MQKSRCRIKRNERNERLGPESRFAGGEAPALPLWSQRLPRARVRPQPPELGSRSQPDGRAFCEKQFY